MNICIVVNCSKPQRRKTGNRPWCEQHYNRWRLYGNPEEPSRQAQRRFCPINACGRPAAAHGLCSTHAARKNRTGDPYNKHTRPIVIGKTTCQGYVLLKRKGHPNAFASGWIAEHRLLMSEMLGRPLLTGEEVHHKNGDRGDNRPENLELWITKQPRGQRIEDMVAWAREIIERYGSISGGAHERLDENHAESPPGNQSILQDAMG